MTLNNRVKMSDLGFGIFQVPDPASANAASAAIDVGYRPLDTATSYGNEEAVALQSAITTSIVTTYLSQPNSGFRMPVMMARRRRSSARSTSSNSIISTST